MRALRNPTYSLGTIIGGYVYVYTALGRFRTAAAAVARCRETRAYVFETFECWSNGVNYGSTGFEPVAQVCST